MSTPARPGTGPKSRTFGSEKEGLICEKWTVAVSDRRSYCAVE